MPDFIHFDDAPLAEQIERWEQCLRVLETMPAHEREHHFDMSDWGTKTECGTVACAAGHCGLDAWFRERGFQMDVVACDCGAKNCYAAEISNVPGFFGVLGAESIFYNATERSVETVIKEVRAHLESLKA